MSGTTIIAQISMSLSAQCSNGRSLKFQYFGHFAQKLKLDTLVDYIKYMKPWGIL